MYLNIKTLVNIFQHECLDHLILFFQLKEKVNGRSIYLISEFEDDDWTE